MMRKTNKRLLPSTFHSSASRNPWRDLLCLFAFFTILAAHRRENLERNIIVQRRKHDSSSKRTGEKPYQKRLARVKTKPKRTSGKKKTDTEET